MAPGAHVDLLVVGAGPAGSAAAIEACERGLDVLVIDRARFPRDKTCGDGLTAGALHRLEALGVDPRPLPTFQPVHDVVLRSPSDRHVELPLPSDGIHAAVVTRRELDAALLDAARGRGARVRDGVGIVSLTSRDRVVATLSDGAEVHARHAVAADGHHSTVRRLLEPAPPPPVGARGAWVAFRQYWKGVADPRLWVLFEKHLLPGYAWVFPLPGGRANVGFGMLHEPGVTGRVLHDRWEGFARGRRLRSAVGPHAEPEGRPRAWPIPGAFDPRRLAVGRVVFAGDAAGVVDSMTGEGIAQALETGVLAARAVAAGGPVGARYVSAVQRALGADLRLAAALQRVLRSPARTRAAIRAAGWKPWTRRNFARWMFEDYPRAVLATPRRWHRGMLTGAGAYLREPSR